MKTPTPEEVINNILQNEFDKENLGNTTQVQFCYKAIHRAMRDYAEALYTERIEEAGSELPDFKKLLDDFPNLNNQEQLYVKYGWEKMKQAASVVIAKMWQKYDDLKLMSQQSSKFHAEQLKHKEKYIKKLKGMYDESVKQYDLLNKEHKDIKTILISAHKKLEQKDKEIDDLKIANKELRDKDVSRDVKEAGESLPDLNSLLNEFPGMNNHDKVIAKIIWEKMKQAASLVIAKEREKYRLLQESIGQLNSLVIQGVEDNKKLLQQKDKEIEELKTSIHNYNSQFKYKP